MCHRPGGSAPFSLLTYEDAARRARQITVVTRRRYMPPWKPEPGNPAFLGERRLTDREIAVFRQWLDAGLPEGDTSELPELPLASGEWQLGTPDLVVEMEEPYLLPAEEPDVFRTFVIALPVDKRVYVKAFEYQPGAAPAVVHHANLLVDPTPRSRSFDQTDPLPGYEGAAASSAAFPDGHFLGWTPGQMPAAVPEDMAWQLDPGTDLVLELHLRPSGKREPVRSRVALFFSDQTPTRVPALLRLSRQDIDIPAGARAFQLEDEYQLPVDVELHRIQPHAHYLARTIEASALLPDGSERRLIRIPEWDFNWQDSYQYVTPLLLPKGTRLRMRYTYDNSTDNPRNPFRPPRRVQYGQRSIEEMAELYMQVVTRTTSDRELLLADYRPKEVREFIVGFELMLGREPDNPVLHSDLGSLYFEAGDAGKALEHFTEALNGSPGSALNHNNLGVALQALGKLDDALAHYSAALQIEPNQPASHYNIGIILELRGEMREAVRHFNLALTEKTRWPDLLVRLGWILATSADAGLRDGARALAVAREAAEATAFKDSTALDALAAAYAAVGRYDEAIETAQTALDNIVYPQAQRAIESRLQRYRRRLPYVAAPTRKAPN
jgi:tetratricopeptide (TPR) repeat protein